MRNIQVILQDYDKQEQRAYALKTKKARIKAIDALDALRWELFEAFDKVFKKGEALPVGHYTILGVTGGMGGLKVDGVTDIKIHEVFSEYLLVSYPGEEYREVCKLPLLECCKLGRHNLEKLLKHKGIAA